MTTTSSGRQAVVITGATGFLGRELLLRFMNDLPTDHDIVCLVRGQKGLVGEAAQASATRRLGELLAESGLAVDDPRRTRVHAQHGDIDQPRLGLSELEFTALAERSTEIFHGAATVRFDLPLKEAERTNVGGTEALVGLARAAQARGTLRRFHYIGTSYVAGDRPGLAFESELAEGHGFHNTYEATKHQAEKLVRKEMAGTESPLGPLPATLYRPSIIVGDSKSGHTTSFKVMYWPLKVFSRGLIPIVPASKDGHVDLIPVDYVIGAIAALSRKQESEGRCYHLAAGPEHSTTIGAAMELAADFFKVYKPLFLPTDAYMKYVRPILAFVLRGRRRQALDAGRVYVPYLNYRGSFDTTNARRDLADTGLKIPDVNEYFLTLLRYCVESDWGKRDIR